MRTITISSEINKRNKEVIRDFTHRINQEIYKFPVYQQELLNQFVDRLHILYTTSTTESEKLKIAQWMQSHLGLSTNPSGKKAGWKAYLTSITSNRKIISGVSGTINSKYLLDTVSPRYINVHSFEIRDITKKLTNAAKPDFGRKYIFRATKRNPKTKQKPVGKFDPMVKSLFANTYFDGLDDRHRCIYGVPDNNGNIKMPSNRYTMEYLEQSFTSVSLKNLITLCKKLADDNIIDYSIRDIIIDHEGRLLDLLDKYKDPCIGLVSEIHSSYDTLMKRLYEADKTIMSSIMKQLAEVRVYETQLASGNEVYLPSDGTFPGGDVIKVMGNRIELISVKYGNSSGTYGCPANSRAISSFHPDPEKRDIQGQYVGELGYTMMVNDKFIRGNTIDETNQNIRKFIINRLDEINLSNLFTYNELNQLIYILTKYCEEVSIISDKINAKKLKSKKGDYLKQSYVDDFDKEHDPIELKYKKLLKGVIKEHHVESLLGKSNVKNVIQKSGIKPGIILSMIDIANNIRTSNGYGISHNIQYFDNDHGYFINKPSSINPDDYSIPFRTKQTNGRNGGGCQLSCRNI